VIIHNLLRTTPNVCSASIGTTPSRHSRLTFPAPARSSGAKRISLLAFARRREVAPKDCLSAACRHEPRFYCGPAQAEENFTLASTGATWGEGLRASFVDAPKFEEKNGVRVTQEFAIDSVFTAKAMATCGNPPFSTVAVLRAEANFLALGGCLQDYDLEICTNYKEIIDSAKEPPRGQLKNWFTPFVLIVMGLVYNTKEASKPASYQDLLNPKYKGRVGIPTYGWVGNSWLQVLNKTLGGNEDNVDPGIAFLAQLVKKNEAVIIENTDAALKAFSREEIVIMPFWNGRTFVLQGQGVPVEIEYIPGTMLVGNGFPVLRGGKFLEQTNRFCNITMDGQYQMMMTQRFLDRWNKEVLGA
jgi:putative spermidine/putrescine transport system substrate-binding protein